jgi:hypothetical protein
MDWLEIITRLENVLIAGVSGSLAIAGVLFGQWLANRQHARALDWENKRWYAQFYLRQELAALSGLYGELIVFDRLTKQTNFTDSILSELEDIERRVAITVGRAMPYVDAKSRKALTHLRNSAQEVVYRGRTYTSMLTNNPSFGQSDFRLQLSQAMKEAAWKQCDDVKSIIETKLSPAYLEVWRTELTKVKKKSD